MSPLSAARPWLPGAVLLAAAILTAALVGTVLGLRAWPAYLGLGALLLVAMGAVERLWDRRRPPEPPRTRGRLKVIRGGKADYDLAHDKTTDNQRYLM